MKTVLEKYSLPKEIQAEALLLGEFTDKDKKPLYSKTFKALDKDLRGLLTNIVKDEDFLFDLGSTLTVRLQYGKIKKIILLGLGSKVDFNLKAERKAVAAGIRKANTEKINKLAFKSIKSPALVAETANLVIYEFDKYKTQNNKDKKPKKLKELLVLSESLDQKTKKSFDLALIIAESVNKTRDLVWEPACVVTPSYLAAEAKKIKGPGISVKILEKSDCSKLKMGSYLAVARGSDQPPKFIELSYNPKSKKAKHLAIVGKGVTFDSGGLSLKPSKSMEMMKEDMSGAAAVLGIMHALAEIQPKNIRVTGIIAATENMPSGKAYRPGDVITAMNGKTIEVNNTDAEGRLTLADAIAYVSKQSPDEIIDIATLTGACISALGNICAGLMTNNQELLGKVKQCADHQDEIMWQLPLYSEYKEKLKSSIADLINAGSGGQAGAQNGALFIQEFVGNKANGEQIPWLHIDIAGPCWFDTDTDWSNKGASGIPVRTLLDYILLQSKA
jgi:leucyl aminopeptidase